VTGEQGFRRLVLGVQADVFIPRPETEVLVQVALDELGEIERPVVVDVATGSGAVALAIKDEHPDSQVYATDLAPAAVRLARENAASLGLEVVVVDGDLLEPLPEELRGRVDAVVGNPPYVPVEAKASLPPDVLAEPALAVFGGIELYERLFAGASSWLRSGGLVAVEIEESAADAVSRAAKQAGFVDVFVRRDLTGRDRVVGGRAPRP
jgi:release factor glutamine methyltransferase